MHGRGVIFMSALLCISGCAAPYRHPIRIEAVDDAAPTGAPEPGREFNGVVSCENPLRGGCVFLVSGSFRSVKPSLAVR